VSAVRAIVAVALLLGPAAVTRAEHEEGMPAATCLVLAKAGADDPVSTTVGDGEDLEVPVVVTCEQKDGSEARIELERVEITYTIEGRRDAVLPRRRRQALDDECTSEGRTLDVTLLGGEQKRRPPFRDLGEPVKVTAHLSFRARQSHGKKKLCFGSMEWEIDVRPPAK
jgi:hypothetical protein